MKDTVLGILEDLTGSDEVSKDLDVNLFETGLLDSMATVQLLLELQAQCGIDVPVSEFERSEWDTPNKIIAKVEYAINEKELFKIFGPLICAFLLLGIFLGLPLFNRGKISKEKMREISYSQSTNIFKGRYVKNQAFSGKYVPFFGSSELSRLDALHPSILAEKYHRNYQPFLLGNAGSQSLAHFYSMQPVNSALHGKKAVFIISPQWFVKDGTDDEAFSLYYSNLEGVNWILNSKDSRATRYAASRLLAMPTGSSDKLMEMALKKKKRASLWASRCAGILNIVAMCLKMKIICFQCSS